MKPIDIIVKRLNEGIDIRMNRYTKDVHITDIHEKGVDTSIENNPSVKSYKMNDGKTVKIYSIFKRNSGIKNMDGTPLLYALKNEKGFKFTTSYDEKVFWTRFEKILDKFIQQYGEQNIAVISNEKPVWGVSSGIITPSSKPINKRILDILNNHKL